MRIILRFFGFLFSIGAIAFLIAAAGAGYFYWKYSQDLPDYAQLRELRAAGDDARPCRRRQPARRICARAAALSADPGGAEAGRRARSCRPRTRISTSTAASTPRASCRAVRRESSSGQGQRQQGASTITQQVAKNFLLDQRADLRAQDPRGAARAAHRERPTPKDKILELYLNEIYLGAAGNYGIAAAALNYFGKSVHELTIAEAAYLAALPKAPEQLPSVPPDAGGHRAPQLGHRPHGRERLRHPRGRREGQEGAARRQPARRFRRTPIAAGYFAEEVRREIAERYGEKKLYEGGLSVRTTLDPKMQAMARKALVDGLVRYDEAHGWRGAIQRRSTCRPRLGPGAGRGAGARRRRSPGGSPSCSTSTAARPAIGLQPTRETSGQVVARARDRHRRRPTA